MLTQPRAASPPLRHTGPTPHRRDDNKGEPVAGEIQYDPQGLQALNFALAAIVFSVALHLRLAELRAVLAAPRVVAAGLAAQWLLLPALTLALILLLRPEPAFAAGMMLIAACPGGSVSNYFVLVARGNALLSVGLTSFSTLACVLSTPLIFAAGMALLPAAADSTPLAVPLSAMLSLLVWTVLLPLLAGVAVQALLPALADRLRAPSRWLAGLLLAAIIGIGFFNNAGLVGDWRLAPMLLMVIVHNTLALAGGYGLARLTRCPEPEARAITLETGIQNAGLGLILIFNFYPETGAMMTLVATWGVWHLVAGAVLARWWRGRPLSAPETRPA